METILLTIVFALILITQLVVIRNKNKKIEQLENQDKSRLTSINFQEKEIKEETDLVKELCKNLHNMETNRNYYKKRYLALKK